MYVCVCVHVGGGGGHVCVCVCVGGGGGDEVVCVKETNCKPEPRLADTMVHYIVSIATVTLPPCSSTRYC